jgi:hypothetical protein
LLEEYFLALCSHHFPAARPYRMPPFSRKKWKSSLHGILPIELVGSDDKNEQGNNPEEGDKRHLFDPYLIGSCSMAIDPNQPWFK